MKHLRPVKPVLDAIFTAGMSFTAKIFVSAIEITVKMSIFAWV